MRELFTSVSPDYEPWLTCQSPLTERLERLAGEAQLQVLSQGFQAVGDNGLVAMDGQRVWVREILMRARAIPTWYARTLIPEGTYAQHQSLFKALEGDKTVGDLIFREPRVKRTHLQQALLTQTKPEFRWLNQHDIQTSEVMPMRLSTCVVAGEAPFYLVEILLPGLLEVLACD